MRVGASLQDALGNTQIPQTDANLSVLSIQESGIGWCWAYVGDGNVHGVEWMTYDTLDPNDVTEYTLTYVLTQDGTVNAIRVKAADVFCCMKARRLRSGWMRQRVLRWCRASA